MAGGEIIHQTVFDGDEIAAYCPVIRSEPDTHCHGFERRSAGVNDERIVTKKAQGGDVAGRSQGFGHIVGSTNNSHLCDAIDIRQRRGLKRRSAPQLIERLIRATIGDDNDIFHEAIVGENSRGGNVGGGSLLDAFAVQSCRQSLRMCDSELMYQFCILPSGVRSFKLASKS